MDKSDLHWIQESTESGNKYGFPKCCIDEFVSKPPSIMKSAVPTFGDLLRFEMAKVHGEYTGFIPCLNHAKMIKEKKITLPELIDYKKREDFLPFPHGWSFK